MKIVSWSNWERGGGINCFGERRQMPQRKGWTRSKELKILRGSEGPGLPVEHVCGWSNKLDKRIIGLPFFLSLNSRKSLISYFFSCLDLVVIQ